MSQAYADGTEPPLPDGAKERAYIDQMANESGLSSGDFVATTVGTLAAATGMVLSKNPGVVLMDAALGDNLDNLISAADYPAWDTLTQTQQASYGSKENYDSTKYVALMEAFDLNDGFSRFKETGSSGGGFTFTNDESNRLKHIGSIGQNWAKNIGNSIEDLRETLNPGYDEILYRYLYGTNQGGQTGELEYNGENYDNWNDNWNIKYKLTNVGYIEYKTGSIWKVQSSSDVYLIMNLTGTVTNDILTSFNLFSKTPFVCGGGGVRKVDTQLQMQTQSTQYTTPDGDVFYYSDFYVSISGPLISSSQTISLFNGNFRKVEQEILFGESSGSGSSGSGELIPDIEGYPSEEIPSTTVIYYPSEGIQPSTTWNKYVTVQRPDNPFNPNDQTSTPEWKQETKQNVQGLQGIHFDKLFPFSMVYSIPNLVNVVRNGVATDSQPKNVVIVPFRWSDTYVDDLRLDLSDLVSLLVMVRPFNRVLLVFALLMALVLFWKSILTGD